MKKYDITLLTEAAYMQAPAADDWYAQQVWTEDKLVAQNLEKKGLRVHKMNWENNNFEWSNSRYILFRTCWNYQEQPKAFFSWLRQTALKTQFINAEQTVHWNIDKHYLLDLKERGVAIPQTHFIEQNSTESLQMIFNQLAWPEIVLKPCVSAGGRHTYRINNESIHQYASIFDQLIKEEALMIQPFLNNIITKGEVALMVIGGKYTHAVLKKAKKGDFRVQDNHGGSTQAYEATAQEITFAERAVRACDELPAYARVDIVYDNNNLIVLSEIELIEPEMWFRDCPKAALALADVIVQRYFS